MILNSRPIRAIAKLVNHPMPDIPIHINGFKIYGSTPDRIVAIYHWSWNNKELNFLRRIIKPGMTVIDIGANIGYYTLNLARLVKPSGTVFSFEPEPENYRLLTKNIDTNKFLNVIALKRLISDYNGMGRVFICQEHRGDHRTYLNDKTSNFIEVKSVILDDFFKDIRVDFIKMDIQGYEYRALFGASELIRRNPNIKIITEYDPELLRVAGSSGQQFLNLINRLGFKVEFIDRTNLYLSN